MNYGLGEPLASKIPRRTAGVPTTAFLQLSDNCNHSCSHCYQVHGQRSEMSTAEVKTLLDDLASAGVLFLTLTGGEVTLRRDLLEIVRYARRLRFALKIYTNAYLVDDAMARHLADEAVLEVHVSVYSAHAEAHDGITKVPGSHTRTLRGIEAMRRQGLKVVMKMPFMKINSGTYGEFIELAQRLGCDYTIDPTIDVREDGSACTADLRASDDALRVLAADLSAQRGRRLTHREKPLDATPCGACGSAFIEPDGTILPCSSLPFVLGKAGSVGLAEAYRESPVVDFVHSLTWGNLPACRVCDLRSYCQRCHANAMLEDGDLFGPSRAACQWARASYRSISGTSVETNEPDRGPYEVGPAGEILARSFVAEDKPIPHGIPVAGVRRSEKAGRPRIHLPILTQPGFFNE